MNKKELVQATSKNSSLDAKIVELVLDSLVTTITSNIEAGEKVDIKDFGYFKLKAKPARKARNPKTGETVNVPAKNTVTFKPSKSLLEKLN